MMKNLKQIMQEIISLTTEIEVKYPELYVYLNETPLDLGDSKTQQIRSSDLEHYLNTLKSQLEHHIQTHPGATLTN